MTMTLSYNGNQIINYVPERDDPKGQETYNKWWITSFDSTRPHDDPRKLTATYTLDFRGKEGMYDAFIQSDDYIRHQKDWSVSKDNDYMLTLTF